MGEGNATKSMEKKIQTVAAFDFDGTLTRRDTLLEFIKFACGRRRFLCGFALYSPMLVAYKLGLYPNWKAKQRLFAHFFGGMPRTEFARLGRAFAAEVDRMARPQTLRLLRRHLEEGAAVYVVSASVEEWVRPWCEAQGVRQVLCTRVEADAEGRLTGRFLTPNCYGAEKVRRLEAVLPPRSTFRLCAYGDSRSDKELLAYADEGTLVR